MSEYLHKQVIIKQGKHLPWKQSPYSSFHNRTCGFLCDQSTSLYATNATL